ncbi:MAG: S-adenosyl-L-methionine-dependent methyltransferase [Benjaminiella poitrasii]|nr:MAG: S-adenosyl-L-methionine-dependent methyltransferase [Benjaminiella poitrasii]
MKLKSQISKWIQALVPACDGDIQHAKRQLIWLKEKVLLDNRRDQSLPFGCLLQNEQDLLDKYVKQRTNEHKPLQYILGSQPFCELDIITQPPTLIPRCETEEWVMKVVGLLNERLSKSNLPLTNPLEIIDVGTGSGCIPLALARHLPKHSLHGIGIDISSDAILLARKNYLACKPLLKNTVDFEQTDIFELDLPRRTRSCNIIISNPPYITKDEYQSLDPDVKEWEDTRALVAEDNGTYIHKRIIEVAKFCKPIFKDIPYLFMEIGGTHQIEQLIKHMKANGFDHIQVWKDFAGKDRVISGY